MKVSVAMTTYNAQKYILRQLGTLKDQSRVIDELIICDDGSTDLTAQLVREYIDKHGLSSWNFTVNEQNLGFVENFRHAVSLTSGDIVFLCDHDDEWELSKIEVMTGIFNQRQDVEALLTSISLIDSQSTPIAGATGFLWYQRMLDAEPGSLLKVDFMEICCENFAPGCTIAMRRSIADEYTAFENSKMLFHDWLIGLLAARRGTLYMLFAPLIKYRIHPGNALGAPTTKEEVRKSSARRDRLTEIRLFSDLKERAQLGMDMPYEHQQQLRDNVAYIDARIRLYTKRTPLNLIRAIWASRKAKNVTQNKFRTNCRDILVFLRILCRDQKHGSQ